MGRGPSIEGRKNAEDAKRAKVFTKLIRDITLAARTGADPNGNAKLRSAMDKALAANMTKDTMSARSGAARVPTVAPTCRNCVTRATARAEWPS